MANEPWRKDPADVAPYTFEWNDWLIGAETIATATVTVADGLTKLAEQVDDPPTSVTFRVSGGVAPARVVVTCTVTTSAGNVYQTDKTITIRERRV